MGGFKFLRGYEGVRFVPVLEPGVRWIDRPELEISYFDGGVIHTRRYHSQIYNLRDSSLRSFIDNNPDAYIAIFQAMHVPTGTLISVREGNVEQLDFRQPDMNYRMVVINDLTIPEREIDRIF